MSLVIINSQEVVIEIDGKQYHCALDVTMSFIAGKWKSVLLWYLRTGKMRFSELKRAMPQITEKMLSLQLKELERDGIIERKVYPEVPPRVEYSMTNEGKTLIPCVEELAKWGRSRAKKYGTLVKVA